jgi:CheY-like chemotaxis protein
MAVKDDTVYCDIQMPVAQGRELLQVVSALRNSGAHPNLDTVFAHMQLELTMSIDIVENPQPLGAARPTKH